MSDNRFIFFIFFLFINIYMIYLSYEYHILNDVSQINSILMPAIIIVDIFMLLITLTLISESK